MHSIIRDHEPKTLHGCGEEETLLPINVQALRLKRFEYLAKVPKVDSPSRTVNNNIVKVNDHKFFHEWFQYLVHESHKGAGRV